MRSPLVFILAASLLSSQFALAQSTGMLTDTGRTVVFASGQARQPATLDRAALVLMIDAQAMSVEEAAKRLTTIERGVIDTLQRLNVPTASVQVYGAGVTPYRPQNMPSSMMNGPAFAGRSTIRVESVRPDQLTLLTAAVLAKGASAVASPTLTSSTADSVRRALVPRAFEQARREAETLARAAGGSLGRLLTLNISPAPFEQQQQFVNPQIYDNAPRVIPNANVMVTVNASWILVTGGKQ